MLAVTTAWLAAELVPSPVAYEGVCAPVAHTRLCPRMRMLLHTASPTSASAGPKLKAPFVFSLELHFISLPETMLSKCLARSCACGPDRSFASIAAPTGKNGERV